MIPLLLAIVAILLLAVIILDIEINTRREIEKMLREQIRMHQKHNEWLYKRACQLKDELDRRQAGLPPDYGTDDGDWWKQL